MQSTLKWKQKNLVKNPQVTPIYSPDVSGRKGQLGSFQNFLDFEFEHPKTPELEFLMEHFHSEETLLKTWWLQSCLTCWKGK